MSTLTIAAILFGLAALGGVALFGLRLRGGNPPLALAFGHGLVAASALVTLIVGVLNGPTGGLPVIALVLFVLAATGGFVLLSFHLRKKLLPILLIVGHATIAVSGFVVLLVHLLRQ